MGVKPALPTPLTPTLPRQGRGKIAAPAGIKTAPFLSPRFFVILPVGVRLKRGRRASFCNYRGNNAGLCRDWRTMGRRG